MTEKPESAPGLKRQVYAEQVAMLYTNGPVAFMFTLLFAAILAYVQQEEFPAAVTWTWFGCLALLTVARIVITLRYLRARPIALAQARRWGYLYIAGLGLSGLIWGYAALFLFPTDPSRQAFTTFLFVGILAGAGVVLAARMEAFLIFALPIVLPLAGRYLIQGTGLGMILGVLALMYMVTVLSSMRGVHRTIRTSLELRFDKHELLAEIAERRQVEQALRQSDQRYDLAMKGAREGLWDWSVDTGVFHVSPHISTILGIQPAVATLSVSEWQAYVHPEDLPRFLEAVRAHFRGDSEFFECELRVLRRDGEYRWVFNRGLGLRDDKGWVYRAAGSMGDITEYKRAAEERERMATQLRHAQKMEAVGTLAGGIAHEFNNLLGVIIGYTEMAQNTPPGDARASHYLKQVLIAGNRAKAIANQILTFSRRGESVRKAVDIQRLVSEAVQLLRITLPSTVEIDEHLAAKGVSIVADADQLHQVLMNLGANAAQAMPEGGTLDIGLERIDVDEGLILSRSNLAAGRYVRLSVSDTGIGMDKATLERIFDPFFTTKGRQEHWFPGLSIVPWHRHRSRRRDQRLQRTRPRRLQLYLPCADVAAETDTAAPIPRCPSAMAKWFYSSMIDEPSLVELGENYSPRSAQADRLPQRSGSAGGVSRRSRALRLGDHRPDHAQAHRLGFRRRTHPHPPRHSHPARHRPPRSRPSPSAGGMTGIREVVKSPAYPRTRRGHHPGCWAKGVRSNLPRTP
ncbi:MAG: PAS domain-containing protein [Gammaproteobacteria bacterium]